MKSLLVLPLLAASITPALAQQTPAPPQAPQQHHSKRHARRKHGSKTPSPETTPQQTTTPEMRTQQSTAERATVPQSKAEGTVQQTIVPQTAALPAPTPQAPPPPPVDPAPAPDNSAIDDYIFIQEMRMWQALQAHDLLTLQALFLPDFVEVEKSILTREQVMANLNACTLVGFNMHNHQTRVLSSDAVVITYSGSNEFTCGESHLKGNYNATTTWVLRNGRWVVQVHTEIPVRS